MSSRSDPEPEFTSEEKYVIQALAKRQRDTESLESRALSRYANSAAIINHVWVVGSAIFLLIIGATVYVVNQGNLVTLNANAIANLQKQEANDVSDLHGQLSKQGEQITQIRLDMENKENRSDGRASHP